MDEHGLRESYESPDGITVHGDTMYIAGTRLDRVSGIRDVLDDFTLIPTRQASSTQRYQQALAALKKAGASSTSSDTRWGGLLLQLSLSALKDSKRGFTAPPCCAALGACG